MLLRKDSQWQASETCFSPRCEFSKPKVGMKGKLCLVLQYIYTCNSQACTEEDMLEPCYFKLYLNFYSCFQQMHEKEKLQYFKTLGIEFPHLSISRWYSNGHLIDNLNKHMKSTSTDGSFQSKFSLQTFKCSLADVLILSCSPHSVFTCVTLSL